MAPKPYVVARGATKEEREALLAELKEVGERYAEVMEARQRALEAIAGVARRAHGKVGLTEMSTLAGVSRQTLFEMVNLQGAWRKS